LNWRTFGLNNTVCKKSSHRYNDFSLRFCCCYFRFTNLPFTTLDIPIFLLFLLFLPFTFLMSFQAASQN
jgi:hypothetical protein